MNRSLEQSSHALDHAVAHARAYLAGLAERRVSASPEALQALSAFDQDLPGQPQPPEATLDLLHRFGSPATTASAGGRFFGLVVGGTLPAALGARVLASTWDQIVFNDATSPIGVKLEQTAARWLLDLFGLPADCSVGYVTGTTMANVTCLAAARHHLLKRAGWDVQRDGLFAAPRLRVVASRQIHITMIKALALLGFGNAHIEWMECDAQGRVLPETMPEVDAQTLVIVQAGNVNSGAFDPIAAICARANGAWVHIDGAFGLWAAVSPQKRALLRGLEAASSWVTDGHKWLNTPYDCGIAICRHPASLHEVMATQAPYLRSGEHPAPKDMVPEFSRAARGVEIWAALHSLGRSGLADLVERCCALASEFSTSLQDAGFEVLNDVVLNQVVATWPGAESRMAEFAASVQADGITWFGPTTWQGRPALRFSVASWATTREDIDTAMTSIRETLRRFGLA